MWYTLSIVKEILKMEANNMTNVYVNGSVETIGNDRDIIDIIRDNCGSDFANFIEYRLNHMELSNEQKEEILRNSDYYSYEESLDDWNFCGNDIIEECEKQIEYIDNSKRINKDVLYNSFLTIVKRVRGVL